MGWTKRWSRRLRAVLRRDATERELDEEMAFHLEMQTQANLRAGMKPAEARRQAAIAFGGLDRFKEETRDARAFGWLTGLSLDVRLGARMLVKHPGLTVVGGVGIAVGIAIAAVFEVSANVLDDPLPLDEGDRIVALENWDTEINNQDYRSLHDFVTWRDELTSVRELGAYRSTARNLVVPGGPAEPVVLAEMTASGFGVARVPPLLGRPLVEEDERAGGAPVAVLGYGVWQAHFGGDPGVLGRQVRLGDKVHTVVGVMPEGFAFPMNHGLWVPLRADPAAYERRRGPSIHVFGRLAPGATLEGAQAELETLGRRTSAAFPETHARISPRVVPYGRQLFDDGEELAVPGLRFLLTLLLAVICVNVAVLVYARTANRRGEIAVRSALGASRGRIVAQLFAEALLLAGAAAAVGLAVAAASLGALDGFVQRLGEEMGGLAFWIRFRLSPGVVLHVIGLALLAAVIVGVVPALKATGRRLQASLSQLGGGTGMRFGTTWTVLIVAQVAFAVAALPAAVAHGWDFVRYGLTDPGFPADEYLTTRLVMERQVPPSDQAEAYHAAVDARYAARVQELTTRLRAEPGLAGVAVATDLPGGEPTLRVQVEDATHPDGAAPERPARTSRVDEGFFGAFDVPVLAGRTFAPGDADEAATAVVVNRTFVREVLGGGDPVGRRVRYAAGHRDGGEMRVPNDLELDRWYEIVGVVGDLPANPMAPGQTGARIYHPLPPGRLYPLSLALRVRGAPPAAFVPRLRSVTTGLDPALQMRDLRPLDEVLGMFQKGMRLGAVALALVTLSVLLLSAAGIYALMSFTVTQRRREIGIRAALGADPRRLLRSVFARAAAQLGAGAAVGLAIAVLLDQLSRGDVTGGHGLVVLPAVAAGMVGVGLLATLGPARRGLRIHPMEALREDV